MKKKSLVGWDKKNNRPIFCYDKNCKVIYSTFQQEHFDEGYSFFCYGKLKKPHLFIEREAKHFNQLSHCYYTPLKGMIRFFVTIGDLWGEINAKLVVMNKLQPLGKCYQCKKKLYRRVESCVVLNCKRKLCSQCKDQK